MNIEIGNKPIDFVFQGDELIYPNYVAKDNLVLHYDFSGRTNLDVKKGIAEDLSGNGNDGILENFAYESGSGYDSNSYLEFNNVDDFITIPELNLDVNNFNVAVDGEVLSYRGDDVAKMNVNGLEIGGRNLARKTDLLANIGNNTSSGTDEFGDYIQFRTVNPNQQKLNVEYEANTQYTLRTKLLVVSGSLLYLRWGYTDGTYTQISANPQTEPQLIVLTSTIGKSVDYFTYTWSSGGVRKLYEFKIEKGTIPTDWTPAPEDLQTTRITPIFSNKIKTLMYWNRALTDVELQEVYNVQKHRI